MAYTVATAPTVDTVFMVPIASVSTLLAPVDLEVVLAMAYQVSPATAETSAPRLLQVGACLELLARRAPDPPPAPAPAAAVHGHNRNFGLCLN